MTALPNPNDYLNSPDIQSLKSAANTAQETATNYASAASLLPSKLKQAIEEKVNYNKDIIDQQNKAMATYFAAPATARSDYQNIFNPFDREKLVSQAVSNAYAPYASLTDILGERRGTIADIVNAGTGAFQSGVTAAQGAATGARQSFSDALDLGKSLLSGDQWNYEQTHKAGTGGGSDLSGLADLIKLFNPNATATGTGTQPTEAKPSYYPAKGKDIMGKAGPTVLYHSPAGQWIYDYDGGDWVPVTD